ncbi:uncharacterized protein LOC129756966 [Uranotaenia lowii]|uniref:uncharacterized protein LOC129756966 n=1 Tax=Uranotaenia lowii TaxID=190385 RepID=UPI0024789316|nr:uncharacterized protein LOC129756966 [Uranotaenia lowii]
MNSNINVMMSTKRVLNSDQKFRKFRVNWEKIGGTILKKLSALHEHRTKNPESAIPRELHFTKQNWTSLVQSVIDQMIIIDKKPSATVLGEVAKSILLEYPCLGFTDDDGFERLLGYIPLKQKLISRRNYLLRFVNEQPHQRASTRKSTNRNLRAGTLTEYWQMSSNSCSKEVLSTLQRNDSELLSDDFLVASQPYVRFILDESKPVLEIMSQFPVMKQKKLLSFHFERATGVPSDSMHKYFTAKRCKIIDYSKTKKKFQSLDDDATDLQIIDFICGRLGERISDLIIAKEMGTQLRELRVESNCPVIVAIDLGNRASMHYVFLDEACVTGGTVDLIEALSELMYVQFVYNRMYSKHISKFLEFIQEYFFKISSVSGSKSKATRTNRIQRLVASVIEEISNFSSPI